MRMDGASSERSASPSVQPPESTFGKYVLLRKLASGGMGEIFLAKERGPRGVDELLVIKRILSHHLDKRDYLDMFFSEARLVARLDHPNIIRIREMGEIQGDHYIAMEYVRGKSLRDIIDELRAEGLGMPVPYVVELGMKLCEGLGHAHQARDSHGRPMNVVHRDINPHNILVSYTGDLKLIDFGIAKSDLTSAHTATGTIKGKFVYMSPEQSAADPVDRRSDIFSLGIVLYEMLALENPFIRQNVVLSLQAIQRHAVPAPSLHRPEAAALDAVLLRALEKSPEARFQTALEMRDALRASARGAAIPPAERNLSAFLHELFSADIAEEARLLAQAGLVLPASPGAIGRARASEPSRPGGRPVASPLAPPPLPSRSLAEADAFLDEEPTVTGDPEAPTLCVIAPPPRLPTDLEVSDPALPFVGVTETDPTKTMPQAMGQGGGPLGLGFGETSEADRGHRGPQGGGMLDRPALARSVAYAGLVPASAPLARAEALGPATRSAPKRPRGRATLRFGLYIMVFIVTTVAGFWVTRSVLDGRPRAEPAADESPATAVLADGPPPVSVESESADAAGPVEPSHVAVPLGLASTVVGASSSSERPMGPNAEPSAIKTPNGPREALGEPASPPSPRKKRRHRRPSAGVNAKRRAASSPPAPGDAPESGTNRVEQKEGDAGQSSVRGRLSVSVSSPMALVADGRSLGVPPSTLALRRRAGKLVLSGGRDIDYAITLSYVIEPEGLAVKVASSPWAIVKHDGLSLGRTPQGPVSPARQHRFSFIRPGQMTPLVVTLAWSGP